MATTLAAVSFHQAPEIAARAHVEALDHIIGKAMAEANVTFGALDGVAAAAGPGLVGGVIVGLMAGKGIALACGKPFVAVNHLEAHALTARLAGNLAFSAGLDARRGQRTNGKEMRARHITTAPTT